MKRVKDEEGSIEFSHTELGIEAVRKKKLQSIPTSVSPTLAEKQ